MSTHDKADADAEFEFDTKKPLKSNETTIRWFGKDWGAPVCLFAPEVPVPVGERCHACDRPIAATDHGIRLPLVSERVWLSWHLGCFGESIGLKAKE